MVLASAAGTERIPERAGEDAASGRSLARASLGAARIIFFESAKGDPGYLTSSLWKDGEWREHVLKGTEQACSTLVPEVTRVGSLAEDVALIAGDAWKVALDPYEATAAPELSTPAQAAVLAIGPERGFAETERAALRAAGFGFAHFDRVKARCSHRPPAFRHAASRR